MDLDQTFAVFENTLGKFAGTEGSANYTSVQRLSDDFDIVTHAFMNVTKGHNARQNLINYHVDNTEHLSLNTHEQYHDVSKRLIADIILMFTCIKTFLNSLAIFIKDVVPEANLRGLRCKSFGALVDSATKKMNTNTCNELIDTLSNTGRVFEEEYVAYRDKKIDHRAKLEDRSLSTASGNTKIFHYDKINNCKKIDNTSKITEEETITVLTDEGNKLIYLHLAPSESNKEGKQINKGDVLGTPCDSTNVHFKKYGTHYHIFASETNNAGHIFNYDNQGEHFGESPDHNSAYIDLLKLVTAVVVSLKQIEGCKNA